MGRTKGNKVENELYRSKKVRMITILVSFRKERKEDI